MIPKDLSKACLNLLFAAMVLAGAVLPPATRHAHPGGRDLSHRHDGVDDSPLNREAYIAHSDHAGKPSCEQFSSSARNARFGHLQHLHFDLLGLRLAISDKGHPAKDSDDHRSSELVFLRASREMISIGSNPSADRVFTPAYQSVRFNDWTDLSANAYSSDSVTTTLLCDRARHERSGVQLT